MTERSSRILKLFGFAFCLSLTFSSQVRAQNNDPWTKVFAQQITWRRGDPNSDEILVDGSNIRIVREKNITVAFHAGDDGDYYIAEVVVANTGDTRIDVKPQDFRIAYWKKKADETGDWLYNVPPEKVSSKYRSRAKWAVFFRSLAAGMATTTTTTRETGNVHVTGSEDSASGTYSSTSTTTSPNRTAQLVAAMKNARTMADADSMASNVINTALKGNTLFPGEYISGIVYFQRKKFAYSFAILRINNVDYQFGLGPTEKR